MEIKARKTTKAILKPLLFHHSKPAAGLIVSVIVPVRDEAAHLFKTLEALRLQRDSNGVSLNPEIYEVLLLANNCSDSSFSIAKKYQLLHPLFQLHIAEIKLPKQTANIGTVRGLLMDEACNRLLSVGNSNGIIASTDGDSEVDPAWIFHIMDEIKKGNDAVGGRITTNYSSGQPCRYYVENEEYRNLVAKTESITDPLEYDPWPTHFQYFGASLAVTCAMYRQVGGLPRLPFLEDEALFRALLRRDARIRKSPDVKVTTSNRQEGRVEIGFSQQLREWTSMKDNNLPQLVASAEELIIKYKYRQKLRGCWLSFSEQGHYHNEVVENVADKLCISRYWLQQEIKRSSYFGDLWENVEMKMYSGKWGMKWKPVVIAKAIAGLKDYTEKALIK